MEQADHVGVKLDGIMDALVQKYKKPGFDIAVNALDFIRRKSWNRIILGIEDHFFIGCQLTNQSHQKMPDLLGA